MLTVNSYTCVDQFNFLIGYYMYILFALYIFDNSDKSSLM